MTGWSVVFMKDVCQYFNFRFLFHTIFACCDDRLFWFFFSLRETTVDLITMNFGNLFIYICYRESCVIFNWDFLSNLLRSSRPTYKLIFILQLVLFLGFFFTDDIILVTSSLVGSLSVEIRSPSMLYQCRHKGDLTEQKVQKIRSTQSTFLLTCKQKRVL